MQRSIPSNLLEIKGYDDEGYKPIHNYESWRVAILNYIEELKPENITTMQAHLETDEIFVVLKGDFVLFVAERPQEPSSEIFSIKLEPSRIYNVKQGVWHTHTLSTNASVLIVENHNTTQENSISVDLTESQRHQIREIAAQLLPIS